MVMLPSSLHVVQMLIGVSFCMNDREEVFAHKSKLRQQIRGEVFGILSSLADLSNAIHWMPTGFLWAGRFPPWMVGLMGTASSLIGLLQMSSSEQEHVPD